MSATVVEAQKRQRVPGTERLPWEIVETFPSTDDALIATWHERVEAADSSAEEAHALVGRALSLYWAAQEGAVAGTWKELAERRESDVFDALDIARSESSPDLLATALLGVLYATWGPDRLHDRGPIIRELMGRRAEVEDEELRLRILEWVVLDHLDHADLDAAGQVVELFALEAARTELIVFRRREVLWRGCLAMLDGRIDDALRTNQEAISSTANTAGSPFSFQNVAITLAIERYFRCGLGDVIDTIRAIRASSPRVAPNWDTGLAFALSESGQLDEAAEIFTRVAADGFAAVPRDLNWLVTMQLLALISITIDDRERGVQLLDQLRPFAAFDATHGSGYASYGPVGRVVAALSARWGDRAEAERWFDHVLATRLPSPWTSLTLLDRAESRQVVDPAAALNDAMTAEIELRAFGFDEWADRARSLGEEIRLAGHGGPIARLAGRTWSFRHPTGAASVDAGVGAAHLVRLLARPGDVIDVVDLDPIGDPSLPVTSLAESTLDQAARAAYRRRIDELDRVATRSRDEDDELSFLRRELAGSSHYVSTSSELERARVRVTKAIRRVIDDIALQSPALGQHLRECIETGRNCLYNPPYQPHGQPAWLIARHDR